VYTLGANLINFIYMVDLNSLFTFAKQHIDEHDCSAHPYEHVDKLLETIAQYQPRKILEIGTGVGYTAAAMALSFPEIKIDTMEKDEEHAKTAREFLNKQGLWHQVSVIRDSAETALPLFQSQYDFIFFDGFQIHYEFLPQYKRLIPSGGILFLANNHLKSKTSDQFFAELSNEEDWKILEQFADTTIAQRQ
jgi:predicted O-methyltransferase YrrM